MNMFRLDNPDTFLILFVYQVMIPWLVVPIAGFLLFLSSRLRRDKLVADIICHILLMIFLIAAMDIFIILSADSIYSYLLYIAGTATLYSLILPFEYKNKRLKKGLTVMIVLLSFFVWMIAFYTETERWDYGGMLFWIFSNYVKYTISLSAAYIVAKLVNRLFNSEILFIYERHMRLVAYALCIFLAGMLLIFHLFLQPDFQFSGRLNRNTGLSGRIPVLISQASQLECTCQGT